ncbi:MAG: valine--tRNA ligase [Hyphomicrobiaceae bacterium]
MQDTKYNPADIEARIHAAWEAAGAFKAGRPERADAPAYCIVIPPPNVTGSLHMGHALNNTLQDVLCRFERMRGKDVLWQPGTDHAGIATQLVVSRQLAERQIDYKSLGREAFLEKVWEWKAQSGGTIVNQLKRLGASCDWSRERFTMDEGLSRAVLKVFVELHRAGLIYKDKRLVNWDPEFQSAVSDLEVEQKEHTGSFKWAVDAKDKDGNPVPFNATALAKILDRDPSGHMYYIRYPLVGVTYDADDPATYIVVGTTRPETMLGDTGVAIHPENEKLKGLIGRECHLPLTGRTIPIVGDTYADPEKGTGAVKITPAHDFNDWEVGKRAKLAVINILDAKGTLNEAVPDAYRGMDRFEARKRIVGDLEAEGVLEKIEPHTHAIPHAQRGDAVIEPWLTDQWYVDAATLAKPALEAVAKGDTRFVPEKYAGDYFRWLENIQPWCISRQLWWGHQIPAWYGPKLGHDGFPIPDEQQVFVAATEEEAIEQAERAYPGLSVEIMHNDLSHIAAGAALSYKAGIPGSEKLTAVYLLRDPDVLDTWFSSALWPFSTLGWPDETRELKRFYPTSCLVTGFDIIFFWVARMMMDGIHFMNEVPFKDVYIHGLVLDEKGQKMSKTKGNVMDPLELIDVYGADALRFTLAAMTAQGRNVRLSKQRVEGYRNFATKLWNATRFAEMNECRRVEGFDPKSAQLTINRWIAGETERTAAAVTAAVESYRFNDAAAIVYEFVWGTFCDWYVELTKPILTPVAGGQPKAEESTPVAGGQPKAEESAPVAGGQAKTQAIAETQATTAWALDRIFALLHPFMPFITEELWEKTGAHGPKRDSLLALAQWPALSGLSDAAADDEIGWLIRLVSEVRSIRSEMNVPAGAKIPLVIVGASEETKARAARHNDTIVRLARLEAVSFAAGAPKGSAQVVVGEATACLPLAGIIDMGAERKRIAKEIDKTVAEVKKVTDRLGNPQFMSRAPEEVVEELRERQADWEQKGAKLRAALARIEAE